MNRLLYTILSILIVPQSSKNILLVDQMIAIEKHGYKSTLF